MTETESAEGDVNTSVFIYNGTDEIPRAVTRLKVDTSVKFSIPPAECSYCVHLAQVVLPEGLELIGCAAFSHCKSLKTINIPSTVTKIGETAFANCCDLKYIVLPRGLLTLGKEAFEGCRSLETIHFPPLIQAIKSGAFRGCTSLKEVILPQNLQVIQGYAFQDCKSLTSVDFPSTLKVIGTSSFYGTKLSEFNLPDSVKNCDSICEFNCPNFRVPPLITNFDMGTSEGSLLFIELSENVKEISIPEYIIDRARLFAFPDGCNIVIDGRSGKWPKQRFKELQIHQICYYHSYHHTGKVLLDLNWAIHPWSTETHCGEMSDVGKRQDSRGMTPLHILACSTKHNMEMYQLLVEKYPENLIVADKLGDTPLTYAFTCNAPMEIIDFLLESHMSEYPDYNWKWEDIADSVIYMRAPVHRFQLLLETHKRYFPHQEIDLKSVVLTRVAHGIDKGHYNIQGETFRFLLQASIATRLDLLNVNHWRSHLEERIFLMSQLPVRLDEKACGLYSELNLFEWKKEIAPLLELALWKVALADRFHKKARIDDDFSHRIQCRVKCGADVVIRNVLNFIGSEGVSVSSDQPAVDEPADVDVDDPVFDDESDFDY
jgi:hypothetical protein